MTQTIEQQPLLIRLLEDVGLLPAGPVYRLPNDVSQSLIMRRLATPVASLGVFPDLELTESELEDVGLDWAAIQAIKPA